MHHAYLHNIKRGGGRDKGKDGERGRRKDRPKRGGKAGTEKRVRERKTSQRPKRLNIPFYNKSCLPGCCQLTVGRSKPGCCQVTVGMGSRQDTKSLGHCLAD